MIPVAIKVAVVFILGVVAVALMAIDVNKSDDKPTAK